MVLGTLLGWLFPLSLCSCSRDELRLLLTAYRSCWVKVPLSVCTWLVHLSFDRALVLKLFPFFWFLLAFGCFVCIEVLPLVSVEHLYWSSLPFLSQSSVYCSIFLFGSSELSDVPSASEYFLPLVEHLFWSSFLSWRWSVIALLSVCSFLSFVSALLVDLSSESAYLLYLIEQVLLVKMDLPPSLWMFRLDRSTSFLRLIEHLCSSPLLFDSVPFQCPGWTY